MSCTGSSLYSLLQFPVDFCPQRPILENSQACSSLNMTDQVSHPYKTTDKITLPHISTFMHLHGEREYKRHWNVHASKLSAGQSTAKFDKSHHLAAASIQTSIMFHITAFECHSDVTVSLPAPWERQQSWSDKCTHRISGMMIKFVCLSANSTA